MKLLLEWLAPMLVWAGVVGISYGVSQDIFWALVVGSALTTFGVRLAIDCAKAGRS